MKLMEFEGKVLFQEEGIQTPTRKAAANVGEVLEAAEEIGFPVVLKAQVLSGGRGKRGGVKVVESREEAEQMADTLFQQGLTGEPVNIILVEETLDIAREFYVSITNDSVQAAPLLMASAEGGVDIESVPEDKISFKTIDTLLGLFGFQVRDAVSSWQLEEKVVRQVVDMGQKLYRVYKGYSADLVEINPLVLTSDNRVVALDAKVIIDDNAVYRQQKFSKSRDRYDNELEYLASQNNLSYVKLDGNIGLLCTGAGLTLASLDLISDNGGAAANFLESGGANYANTYHGLKLVLSDPDVKVLLINTFGLVSRSDVICRGLADSLKELKPAVPIVASIRGTGEEEARRIFREELGIEPFTNMEDAVKEVIRLAEVG